jgi:uncharacterized protein YjlB
MAFEDVKAIAEKLTGLGRPRRVVLRIRKPHAFHFRDDGETPNNPRFPMILYRSPVKLDPDYDPAALFETLFAAHDWGKSCRDGIYDFNHFHTATHEVLGIARGHARVRFGGRWGKVIEVRAGDVIVQPAGNGHQWLSQSKDLLVVGAYPKSVRDGGGHYDEPGPKDVDHDAAVRSIARVAAPHADPVYGASGPLTRRGAGQRGADQRI